jgi:hypothetical protein
MRTVVFSHAYVRHSSASNSLEEKSDAKILDPNLYNCAWQHPDFRSGNEQLWRRTNQQPGTGQPGTGNVSGTGTGQGSGAEIPATAQSKTKSHKKSTHKHHKKSAKTKSGSDTGNTSPK